MAAFLHGGSSMENQDWQRSFKEAMLELDPTKLKERIEAADVAIREREVKLCSIGSPIEELTMLPFAAVSSILKPHQKLLAQALLKTTPNRHSFLDL